MDPHGERQASRPERWCARCEWLGSAPPGPCPRCGATLLEINPPATPSADLERPPPRFGPAPPPVEPPPPEAGEPEVEKEEQARPANASPLRRARRPALVLAAAAAVLLAALIGTHRPAGKPAAGAPGPTGLPARIAFVAGGLVGGSGPALYLADGAGRGARPVARGIMRFAWSPSGAHVAAIDLAQRGWLLPGQARLLQGRPVRDVAFSPDGRFLALCGGAEPRISVVLVDAPRAPVHRPVAGCRPVWSPDSRRLALRRPGGGVAVLDVRSGRLRRVPGRWPAAWVPGPRGARLADVAASRLLVEVPGPGAGRLRSLRWSPSRVVFGAPIRLLAFSPDGRWAAAALRGRKLGLVVVARLSGSRLEIREVFDRADGAGPVSLSWSSGDRLLAGFDAPGAGAELLVPGRPSVDLGLIAASWSPDGRWILGRAPRGWEAVAATGPSHRVLLAPDADRWISAGWCCPPTTAQQGP